MTKTERETLELLAKGYNKELKREDVSLAARRALEEIDGINVNCCGRGRLRGHMILKSNTLV